MAITYSSQGAGVSTETSGAALSPLCPATVNAGDILIAHVFWEGTTTAPSTPGGWTLLSGPHVIETTIARHWVFGKIADGTEDGAAVAFGSPAVTTQRAARVYSFVGRVSGTITDLVLGFGHTSNANDPTAPNVTTTGTGSLAVLLISQNDNNAFASFIGESGGDYTEAVAEYTVALTPGFSIGVNTAAMASPGTITGGSDNTTNDPAGVIGFYIRDQIPAIALTATAPVVTLTAPTAARTATRTLTATTPLVTITAPTASRTLGAPGDVLQAGAPVVTFTAPVATRVATRTLTATVPVITITAPVATRVATRVLTAGAPVVTFSAPPAAIVGGEVGGKGYFLLTLGAG